MKNIRLAKYTVAIRSPRYVGKQYSEHKRKHISRTYHRYEAYEILHLGIELYVVVGDEIDIGNAYQQEEKVGEHVVPLARIDEKLHYDIEYEKHTYPELDIHVLLACKE